MSANAANYDIETVQPVLSLERLPDNLLLVYSMPLALVSIPLLHRFTTVAIHGSRFLHSRLKPRPIPSSQILPATDSSSIRI